MISVVILNYLFSGAKSEKIFAKEIECESAKRIFDHEGIWIPAKDLNEYSDVWREGELEKLISEYGQTASL
jgi:hypothetical protein